MCFFDRAGELPTFGLETDEPVVDGHFLLPTLDIHNRVISGWPTATLNVWGVPEVMILNVRGPIKWERIFLFV